MRKMSIQYLDNPGAMDFGQISTLLTEYGAGRSELDRTGAEKAFANSAYALCATDGEKVVAVGRALSDRRAWTLITDVTVLPEYRDRGIGSELLEQITDRFKGHELFTWTAPDQIPFFESHGFKRSKNSFTYAGEDGKALDPELLKRGFFLPAGYRFESEFYPNPGRFPTGRKNRVGADFHPVFSETTDGVDFSRLNEILGLAFGGRERDEQVTRETFGNSPFVEFVHDGGKLVGGARAESDGVIQGFVLNVAVDPAYQGLRLGWETVKRLADQMKGQNIFLNTHPGGVGFYNRQGFRRNRTALVYPAHPDMPEEAARGFVLPVGYRFPDEL